MAELIKDIITIDFNYELQNSHKPIIIFCYERNSALCKLVGAVFEDIAKDYSEHISFYKASIDDSKDFFFEHGVMKIPSIIMFKEGRMHKKASDLKYDANLKRIFINFFNEDITINSKILLFFNDKNFYSEVLKSDIPVLVNYWLPNNELSWSMLKDMEEIYALFKRKIKIGIVDFKDNNECVSHYGISQVPTAAIFINGIVKDKMIGVRSKKGIVNFIKQYVDLGF